MIWCAGGSFAHPFFLSGIFGILIWLTASNVNHLVSISVNPFGNTFIRLSGVIRANRLARFAQIG